MTTFLICFGVYLFVAVVLNAHGALDPYTQSLDKGTREIRMYFYWLWPLSTPLWITANVIDYSYRGVRALFTWHTWPTVPYTPPTYSDNYDDSWGM